MTEEVVLTFHLKEDALGDLSEQLIQAILSGLLSESEARRVAEDLLTTEPGKFLEIAMADWMKV